VPVTLYWRAEQPLEEDYQLFIQFLDEGGRAVANLTSHPGWGRNPTSFWEGGALYADPYAVLVSGPVDSSSPLLARVYVGLIDRASAEADNLPLPARRALPAGSDAGEAVEITPFVGVVELAAWQEPAIEPGSDGVALAESAATFGGVIRLRGHAVQPEPPMEPAAGAAPGGSVITSGSEITATLLWEAQGQPATDYTAYVHMVDAAGQQVAGYDRAPAGERFPTSRWRSGDRILSSFPLELPADLPPGEYTLWVGLYETASAGALRLPVTEAGGLPSGDGQVQIGSITVR
jgi:hypothetical protein